MYTYENGGVNSDVNVKKGAADLFLLLRFRLVALYLVYTVPSFSLILGEREMDGALTCRRLDGHDATIIEADDIL